MRFFPRPPASHPHVDIAEAGPFHLLAFSGFSTFPFYVFGNGWESATPQPADMPYKGDTVIGNYVWLGYDVMLMPGVKVGDGAIIASRSVVVSDVPAYSVVGGNPTRIVKQRFSSEIVSEL